MSVKVILHMTPHPDNCLQQSLYLCIFFPLNFQEFHNGIYTYYGVVFRALTLGVIRVKNTQLK